jgi:hypothetical protein
VPEIVGREALGFVGGKDASSGFSKNVAVVVAAEEETVLWGDGIERSDVSLLSGSSRPARALSISSVIRRTAVPGW